MHNFPIWDGRDVRALVAIQPLGEERFRSEVAHVNRRKTQFGGQLMALAIEAASRTAGDRACHAVSGYFLRAGDVSAAVNIVVERVFEGASFCARRSILSQHGQSIFVLEASFQREEEGVERSITPHPAPSPATLLDNHGLNSDFLASLSPAQARRVYLIPGVEFRAVDPQAYFVGTANGRRSVWMRAPSAEGATEATHRSLLAHLTDFALASTATLAHEEEEPSMALRSASLNQSMWFYRPHLVDRWFRMECDTPTAQSGRTVGRADLFNEGGTIVASAVQEVLIRRSEITPPRS